MSVWNSTEIKLLNSKFTLVLSLLISGIKVCYVFLCRKQLQEVSAQLDEEKRRRVKIENELEKYKNVLDLPDDSTCLNKPMLQSLFCQMYKAQIKKEQEDSPE